MASRRVGRGFGLTTTKSTTGTPQFLNTSPASPQRPRAMTHEAELSPNYLRRVSTTADDEAAVSTAAIHGMRLTSLQMLWESSFMSSIFGNLASAPQLAMPLDWSAPLSSLNSAGAANISSGDAPSGENERSKNHPFWVPKVVVEMHPFGCSRARPVPCRHYFHVMQGIATFTP